MKSWNHFPNTNISKGERSQFAVTLNDRPAHRFLAILKQDQGGQLFAQRSRVDFVFCGRVRIVGKIDFAEFKVVESEA